MGGLAAHARAGSYDPQVGLPGSLGIPNTSDRTFGQGKVGIGSFDDTGMFDDIEVRGDTYKPAEGERSSLKLAEL